MPTQCRLVTSPATKAVAGELTAASSILLHLHERDFLHLVVRGDDKPRGPCGGLHGEGRDDPPPEPRWPRRRPVVGADRRHRFSTSSSRSSRASGPRNSTARFSSKVRLP